jgi:hypothetical protein
MKKVLDKTGEQMLVLNMDPIGFWLDMLQIRCEIFKIILNTVEHHNKPT